MIPVALPDLRWFPRTRLDGAPADLEPKRSRRLAQLFESETLATMREVALLTRDWSAVVPDARPGDDVVVLVHGFMATGGVFRPMRARLEREAQARVATFTHAPGAGIKRIAKQLAALVDRIPRGTRVHVVGHSMGGVVARWYVQTMGGHERVVRTISLASPFGGADLCRKLPLLVGADLHASSEVLRILRQTAQVGDVPHTSIVAGDDRMVVGREAATFPCGGDVVHLAGRGHNSLLFDDEVVRHVVQRICAHRM
jgi:pimeloyl-ACP methyl ester carboxylesterase